MIPIFSEHSAQGVDLYEHSLENYIAGKTGKFGDRMDDYPKVMKYLKDAIENEGKTIVERIHTIRNKFARAFEISEGYDCPDPTGPVDADWLVNLKNESSNEKEEFDWHLAATEINEHISFCFLPSYGAFYYYDPVSGAYQPNADDLISNLLRKAFPLGIGRYHREEIIAWLKDYNIQDQDFFERKEADKINLQNGVFDMSTGKLIRHSPDFRFRYTIPVRFNRHKVAKLFLKTLREITEDDPNKAIKLLEAFAFVLMPGYYPQKAFILYGNGNNGKSTILNVLSAFVGRKNISSVQLQSLADNRFAAASLIGKLANISGDVSQRQVMDSSLFKLLTGGDMVSVEIKGVQRRPEFMNSAKLIFSFNQLPYSYDRTEAYYRRFELVKLVQNFAGREDETLGKRLTEPDELSGILNLVLYIFLPAMLAKRKFHETKSADEVKMEYNLSADTSLAYIQEKLEVNTEMQISADELYTDYVKWCSSEGITSASKESFGNTLLNRAGMIIQKRRKQEEGVQTYYYMGITWKGNDPDWQNTGSPKMNLLFEDCYIDYLKRLDSLNTCLGCLGCLGFLYLDMSGTRNYLGHSCRVRSNPSNLGNFDQYFENATVLMAFREDISLAYYDRNLTFHANDMAYVPPEWVPILEKRGTAKAILGGMKKETGAI